MKLLPLAYDAVAIAVFAFLARVAHRSDDMPLTIPAWWSTYWPFLLGVVIAYIVLVAVDWNALKMKPAGVAVWLITVVTGLGIWGIRHSAFPHWSFILVASLMSALLLFAWRLFFRKKA